MGIIRSYARDRGMVFQAVYVPDEAYSFFINSATPCTDPNFGYFELRIIDGDGTDIVTVCPADEFGTVLGSAIRKALWDDIDYSPLTAPYSIYADFVMPKIPNGEYIFIIFDTLTGEEKIRSNVFLVEQEYIDRSAIMKYRNDTDREGYLYSRVPDYHNIVRIPLSQTAINFESEQTTYRNISDRKLRRLKSYLDKGYRITLHRLDEPMLNAMAEMVECSSIRINDVFVTPKSQLTVENEVGTILNSATFDVYLEQEQYPVNSLESFADLIIQAGNHIFNPRITISTNPI